MRKRSEKWGRRGNTEDLLVVGAEEQLLMTGKSKKERKVWFVKKGGRL